MVSANECPAKLSGRKIRAVTSPPSLAIRRFLVTLRKAVSLEKGPGRKSTYCGVGIKEGNRRWRP